MRIRVSAVIGALLVLSAASYPWIAASEAGSENDRMARLMAGEIVVETVGPQSDAYRGTGLVKVPWERVWQGLTEEEYFTRIFHENKGAVLSEQGGGYDVYCFHARYFLMAFDYCLHRSLDRDSRRIRWHLTEGDFEEMEGEWELVPVNGGQATMVKFTSRVKIGSWIPESWVNRSSRKRIPRTLAALRLWSETGRFLPEE